MSFWAMHAGVLFLEKKRLPPSLRVIVPDDSFDDCITFGWRFVGLVQEKCLPLLFHADRVLRKASYCHPKWHALGLCFLEKNVPSFFGPSLDKLFTIEAVCARFYVLEKNVSTFLAHHCLVGFSSSLYFALHGSNDGCRTRREKCLAPFWHPSFDFSDGAFDLYLRDVGVPWPLVGTCCSFV